VAHSPRFSFASVSAKVRAKAKPQFENIFLDRARILIVRGYKPKDAAEQIPREVAMESEGDTTILQKTRSDAEEFLSRIRQGLI
jgi:hypothetical protein